MAEERRRQLEDGERVSAARRPGTRAARDAAEERLRAVGVDDPGTEARWMLEEVSGMDAAEQVLEGEPARDATRDRRPRRLLDRRAAGEPLQYVLGSWGFCGLDLLVDRRVLIPRPETESVVQHAIAEVARLGERIGTADPWAGALTHYAVADLGTGSGAIALALAAALPDAEVWATDVSDDALAVARANLAGAGHDRGAGPRRRRARGSARCPTRCAGTLLLVVANPPYVAADEELPPVVRDWEPAGALVCGPDRAGGDRAARRRGAGVARSRPGRSCSSSRRTRARRSRRRHVTPGSPRCSCATTSRGGSATLIARRRAD